MATLTQLWQRLNQLNRFSFKVNQDNCSATGWQGQGQGMIKRRTSPAQNEVGAIVETIERGEYQISALRRLSMHNQYLWQFQGDHIRLSHLRFGWDKPVFLFDIIVNDLGELVTRQPHQCAADSYDALFSLSDEALLVQWHIQGPHKHEVLDYSYRV